MVPDYYFDVVHQSKSPKQRPKARTRLVRARCAVLARARVCAQGEEDSANCSSPDWLNYRSRASQPALDALHDAVDLVVEFENFRVKLASTRLLQGHQVAHALERRVPWPAVQRARVRPQALVHLEGVNGEVPGDPSFDLVHCQVGRARARHRLLQRTHARARAQWVSDSLAVRVLPPTAVPFDAEAAAPNLGFLPQGFARLAGAGFGARAHAPARGRAAHDQRVCAVRVQAAWLRTTRARTRRSSASTRTWASARASWPCAPARCAAARALAPLRGVHALCAAGGADGQDHGVAAAG